MSTLAPSPAPQHRFHRPTDRHLAQLGFAGGAACGTLAYFASGHVPIALIVFLLVWYGAGYGVSRVATHPAHPAQWLAHVLVVPVAAIAVAVALRLGTTASLATAVVIGLLASLVVQVAVTQIVLRGVVSDQGHDLRRRLGIED